MKRLLGLAVSLAILAMLWWRVDLNAILAAARAADTGWLTVGLAMVVPITLVTALRFVMVARGAVGIGTASRLILSASTLNLVLPSKMGDIAKAWVLTGRHAMPGERALALVVLEKMLDMASLLAWGTLALLWIAGGALGWWLAAVAVGGLLTLLLVLLSPVAVPLLGWAAARLPGRIGRRAAGFAAQWGEGVGWLWATPARAARLAFVSLALWALHLAQFWLFARALGPAIPAADSMAFATLSILAGLLPLTMAGMGTRDAAIVAFYGPSLGAGAAAVLGVLATSRYLIPALAGLPFLRDFWQRRPAAAA